MSGLNINNVIPSSYKKIRCEEIKYKKSYINLHEIIGSLQSDQNPESLRQTDESKYQQYLVLKKGLEKIRTNGIVTQEFMNSIHDELNQS